MKFTLTRRRGNYTQSELELRLQPFTLLATIPVIVTVAAGLTYTCVYSDSDQEMIRPAIVSACVAVPFVVLFAIVWRREARRPFPVGARLIAWWAMFCAYIASNIVAILLAISLHIPASKRYFLLAWCVIGLPIGHILWRLIREMKKSANQPPLRMPVSGTPAAGAPVALSADPADLWRSTLRK